MHLTATTAAPGAALAAWSGQDGTVHLWQVPNAPAAGAAGDEGEMVVDLEGLSGSVTIRQNGQVLKMVAVPQGQTAAVPLAAGDYEVAWSGLTRGVDVSPRKFTLARGGQQVVGVRRGPEFVGEVRGIRFEMGMGRVALLPDGRHALTSRGEGTLVLWDLETGRAVCDYRGQAGNIWGLAVTPDGKRAVSAGGDGTLRVWDVAAGKEQKYRRDVSLADLLRMFRGDTGQEQCCCPDLEKSSAGGLGLTPDGRQVLCGTGSRLRLVDITRGQVVREWAAPAGQPILSLALSPDGRRALTGHGGGGLILWDVAAGKEEHSFPAQVQEIDHVAFSPDGRLALSASRGGVVKLWDVDGRKELHRVRVSGLQVGAVAFTPDSKCFLISCWDNSLRVWDAAAREEVYRFTSFPGTAGGLAFAAGGRRLVLCGGSGLSVRQLPGPDHDEGQIVLGLEGGHSSVVLVKRQGQTVRNLYVHPGGLVCDLKEGDYQLELNPGVTNELRLSAERVRVKAGRQQVVRVYRPVKPLVKPDPQRLAKAEAELKALLAREADTGADRERLRADLLDFVRNYRGLAPALEAAGALRRLPSPLDRLERDTVPPELLARVGGGEGRQPPPGLVAVLGKRRDAGKGQQAAVRALAFRGDGAVLATGSADGWVTLWDMATATPTEMRSWGAHPGGVRALAFSPDGKSLASGGEDRQELLWDATTGKKLRDFSGHEAAVRAVAFSPDGKVVATGAADGKVHLSAVNGESWKLLESGGGEVPDLAFSPDGSLLACGDRQGIRLWDVETRTIKRTWHGYQGLEHGLAFSPDGSLVASTGWGNSAALWESATGQMVRTLVGNRPRMVHCLAFCADGRGVAGGGNGGVFLWDPQTGEETETVMVLPAMNVVVQVAYSPDGRHLAVSHNGLVSILRLAPAPDRKP
jgi:WD40 repeat protein